MAGRRLMMVPVTDIFLDKLVREGAVVCQRVERGVPADAEYIGATYDMPSLTVYLIYQHASFPEIDMGAAIPWLEVQCRDLTDIPIFDLIGQV